MKGQRFREEHILVCIPSLDHIKALLSIYREVKNVVALTGDSSVQLLLEKEGIERVYTIENDEKEFLFLETISDVYIFETSLTMTCLFLDILEDKLFSPITVLTKNKAYPKQLYTLLGVKQVVYSNSDNYGFLIK
ncbi:hypothetical protein [Bacillus piscicola]|uniref:hypothetical protein n=1 Tax=Bacillus piscicola TaxID=1632684 RepID=UPI001F0928EC|nr:hypothetical protein [Bacillus piscicola]HSH25697.1 hypothetical protein [Massilibacterium sp.]